MPIKGIKPEEEIIIKSILEPYKSKYEFYYYGSRVKGNFRFLSDLDILVTTSVKLILKISILSKKLLTKVCCPILHKCPRKILEDISPNQISVRTPPRNQRFRPSHRGQVGSTPGVATSSPLVGEGRISS